MGVKWKLNLDWQKVTDFSYTINMWIIYYLDLSILFQVGKIGFDILNVMQIMEISPNSGKRV